MLIENVDYVICPICKREFKRITSDHLKYSHNINRKEFIDLYPNQKLCCENSSKKSSCSNKGKIRSEESKEKNRIKHLGKKASEKTKKLMSIQRKDKTRVKRETRICPICNKEFKVRVKSNKKTCCKQCSHILMSKIKKGKSTWNQENSQKRKKSISNNIKKLWQSHVYRENQIKKRNTNEFKKKSSERISNRIILGEFKPNTYYKDGYFFSKLNNRKFYYRSLYELAAYIFLDDEDSRSIIKSWKTECLRLPYQGDKDYIQHTVPDIFVEYKSGKKQIINIKPTRRLKERGNILKHQATQKYCDDNGITFSSWTEKELGITKERYKELLEIRKIGIVE
jgi:hypothetical protein